MGDRGGLFESLHATVFHALGHDCAKQIRENERSGISDRYWPPTRDSILKLGQTSSAFLRLLERKIDYVNDFNAQNQKKRGTGNVAEQNRTESRTKSRRSKQKMTRPQTYVTKDTERPKPRKYTRKLLLFIIILKNQNFFDQVAWMKIF